MERPKLQSLAMATIRCLVVLCLFGLLMGPEVLAQRESRRSSSGKLKAHAGAGKISIGQAGNIPFSIRGRVRSLYPGARGTLTLRVRNPHRFAIEVRSVRVRVRQSDHGGCGRRWVRPRRAVKTSVRVPPKSKAMVSYPVRMLKASPPACSGATWGLRFSGKGARP